MDRNTNTFAFTPPSVDLDRSKFKLDHRHLTTIDAGKLIPLFYEEILPGDTFSVDMSSLIRMATPLWATMDQAFLDTYFFFVPNRIVWDHWRNLMGENTDSPWASTTEYNTPVIKVEDGSVVEPGDLADYFGIPVGQSGFEFDALPIRAYCSIWNEFFRDQNLMYPAYFDKGDADVVYGLSDNHNPTGGTIRYDQAFRGKALLPVCKTHDYFTSCLPSPQKGDAVTIDLLSGDLSVVTGMPQDGDFSNATPLLLSDIGGSSVSKGFVGLGVFTGYNGEPLKNLALSSSLTGDGSEVLSNSAAYVPTNLYVNPLDVAAVTVNQLRMAFQVQKILERDAMSGTRYRELLKAHFGVTSPDARFQIPEYLGGKRIPLNIDQVLQTSSNVDDQPLGRTGGFSVTSDVSSLFTKSFTEHGMLIGVCCIRYEHTYSQGLARKWSRRRRFDYYWPALSNIGNQAVLRKEISLSTPELDPENDTVINHNDEAFGYQEAWAEYRYSPNRVSCMFRPGIGGSLDSWHYADNYMIPDSDFVKPVYLSAEWMQEDKSNIDRTLAVQSELYPNQQFLCDFYFDVTAVRPMPLYSVPGLIDHN